MAAASVIGGKFQAKFGAEAVVVASAPGRVNLIGEHTDYNEGFVLPMAIDRRTVVAAAPRDDERVIAYAHATGELREVDASRETASGTRHWTDYVAGMVRALRADGCALPGISLYVGSTVPIGSGLSSSAALEIALARALTALAGATWDATRMALLSQRVENGYVGVNCGIMDQLISATAREGHALLLDCRSLEATHVAVPDDVAVVVMDTGVRRSLSGTDYNARRSVCEYVVHRLRGLAPGVKTLRDVNGALLETARVLLDDTAWRRARHVVQENARPAALSTALARRDFAEAGRLLDESHASLRDLYEVSSVHLDMVCEEARAHPACYGARMTGAGFGGCAIALVARDQTEDFIARVQPRYEARSYQRSEFFTGRPDEGARLEQPR